MDLSIALCTLTSKEDVTWCSSINQLPKEINQNKYKEKIDEISLYSVTESENRGSYMSAYNLLNLLNKLKKSDKMRGLSSIHRSFTTSLINPLIQEHKC